MTQKGKENFCNELIAVDWEKEIGNMECPSQMTDRLHAIVIEATDRHLPLRHRKIRSTDDPWINDEIRRAIRRRKRKYNRQLRSPEWQSLKEATRTMIKESKQEYYNDAVEKLKNAGSSQLPYRLLKDLAVPDRPKPWTVNQIRPGRSEEEIAEELAEYFSRITDGFTPLTDGDLPRTYSNPYCMVMPHEVAEKIRSSKKSKSAVAGDIPPILQNKLSDIIAIPATRIINHSLNAKIWPSSWRVETQSAIPKCNAPSDFDELRNVSCTNVLSKIMESYVLEKLQSEIHLKRDQFGGIKGSGTLHFLLECWNKILTALDRPEAAVSMISVDFSKAFNRVDHHTCITALATEGASTESIQMIGAFLRNRRMRFKVGAKLSDERGVNGGSPQGTRLGNFLFIITINKIEEQLQDPPPAINNESGDASDEGEDDGDIYGLRQLAGRIGAVRRFDSGVAVSSTPRKAGTTDGVLRYVDESGRQDSTWNTAVDRTILDPQEWPPFMPWSLKYVDDVNAGERLCLRNATSIFSQAKEQKILQALECQSIFGIICDNATKIGMVVNPKKTQLLCVSPAIYSDVSAFITTPDGGKIESQESMTVLGFRFGNRPNVSEHMRLIRDKFNARSWIVRHLKGAGVPEKDIVKVYASVVRSALEYASPIYHSLLTKAQEEELERMQRQSLKVIYGFTKSYANALKDSGVKTMKERRDEAFKTFAKKTSEHPDHAGWFPTIQDRPYKLRKEPKYIEEHAATDRLYRSPLFAMRRYLNEIN